MNQRDHGLGQALNTVFETTSDKAGAVVATGAILSPWWRYKLQLLSEDAALFMPILGATWLSVQIVAKLVELRCRAISDRDSAER